MKGQADALRVALESDDLEAFGEILHEGWMLKKTLASGISNAQIDYWYETGRKHGAKGGKLLGAGGGGFLLFYADKDRRQEIIDALPELRPIGIELEPQGSKIVYIEEHRRS